MQIGSRSLNRRSLILFASISLIFTYYTLKSIQQPKQTNATIWAFQEHLLSSLEIPYSIYSVSLLTAAIFVSFSIVSGYVLPLDTIFVSFFYGYFTSLDTNDDETLFKWLPYTLVLSYLIMPVVSGCITWVVYRIFIRGVMYADEEEKFNRTLGWCGLVYPTALSAILTIFILKFFIYNTSFHTKTFLGYMIIIASWLFSYVLFKIFIRAWIKRRAFLMYPQEYAVYMERSEKVEQGDREARGLGPIQDYYLPKISGANSASITTTASGGVKQHQPSIKDNYSSVEPAISPAVIAGKLAINAKRAEELFFPILNLISCASLFLFSAFDSVNLYRIVTLSIGVQPSIWLVLLAILIGAGILFKRHGHFLGRSIIPDLRFSQAFSIQLGVLLTMTLALLHSISAAPMWYLLTSIAAVCATNPNDQKANIPKQLHPLETDTKDEEEEGGSFRSKLWLLLFFWVCSITFGYSVGFLSTLF